MTRRGLVLFALMSVIWGIPYLFIRIAVAEIPPAMLVLRPHGDRGRDPAADRAGARRPAADPPALALARRVRRGRDRHAMGAARLRRAAPLELPGRPAHRRRAARRHGARARDRRRRSARPDGPARAAARAGRGRRDRRRRLRGLRRDGARAGRCSSSSATPSGRRSWPVAWTACRRSGSWPCRSR